MKEIKIFIADGCSQCDKLKNYLQEKSLNFEEVDLSQNQSQRELLIKQTGYSMVPQIQIDDKFIIGFDERKIDELTSKN